MTDPKEPHLRDDAEDQPESGYPDGRLPTKPSAELDKEESRREAQSGSEAEFDSPKQQR
jgi:hypothetical protein